MAIKSVAQLVEKWAPVLDVANAPAIRDSHRRDVTAVLLENTAEAIKAERQLLAEAAPTTQTQGYPSDGTGLAKYDPVLISMVRRSAPQMMAYDICGVQPMRQSTGLVFAIRSRYGSQSGPEALFNEANSAFSGTGTHAGNDPTADFVDQDAGTAGNQFGAYTRGTGMSTTAAEQLGSGAPGTEFNEMSFTIDQIQVTAKARALKAGYTTEFATDVKNLHGLDADAELSSILSRELLSDVNREVLGACYSGAMIGAQDATTPGVFDLLTDSDGRWLAERHKGLMFQIEREANSIAQTTRSGKGNFMVCTSDVASALAMAGVLDYAPALQSDLTVDDTGASFAGVIKNTRMKVFVDPYSGAAGTQKQFCLIGYKGQSAWDAGQFYCPYVPLQIVRATNPATMSPVLAYRMRYGMSRHPFFAGTGRTNAYYRIFAVRNLLA